MIEDAPGVRTLTTEYARYRARDIADDTGMSVERAQAHIEELGALLFSLLQRDAVVQYRLPGGETTFIEPMRR
jgi:hypothetical protein